MTQIAAAQTEIESQLADLRSALRGGGDDGLVQQLSAQLKSLGSLRNEVGGASGSALAKLSADVAVLVAASIAVAQQAQSAASAACNDGAATSTSEYARATAEARHTAQGFLDDYYEKRKFDKFLTFSSDEDERAYHDREKKRQAGIEQALAAETTEGAAMALRLEQEQMRDAKAHGADKSPEFRRESDKLNTASSDLDAAIVANAEESKRSAEADPHIAALRKAGVTVADQSGEGHGVTMDASIAKLLGRG